MNKWVFFPNNKFGIENGVRFFPYGDNSNLRKNTRYLVSFNQYKIRYFNGIPFYRVSVKKMKAWRIRENEKKIKIFFNTYIDTENLKNDDDESLAKLLIRSPNDNHNSYLILMSIEEIYESLILEYLFGNFKESQILKTENGLIIIIAPDEYSLEQIKNELLKPFHLLFNLAELK